MALIEEYTPFELSQEQILNLRQSLGNLKKLREDIKKLSLTNVDVTPLLEQNQKSIEEIQTMLRVYDSGYTS